MTQEKYDVVIVGAGLAGFAAADEAVDNNLKTLLLKKVKQLVDQVIMLKVFLLPIPNCKKRIMLFLTRKICLKKN